MIEKYDDCPIHDKRHTIKKALSADVHYMNKNERKMLRRLKAKNKMSEKDIRSLKKHRKELSNAQDIGETPNTFLKKREKFTLYLRRKVCREKGITPWSPAFKEHLNAEIKTLKTWGRYPWYMP